MLKDAAHQKAPLLSWQGRPEHLVAGLEQERFIFHNSGRAPTLNEIKSVFERLISTGFNARKLDTDQRPLAVNQDCETGYWSLKPDFATHIIEAASPPHSDPSHLKCDFERIWEKVLKAAREFDLVITQGALILELPPGFTQVPHERRDWLPNRTLPKIPTKFTHRFFNVLMCSTQVHLNIQDESFFEGISAYYSHEYVIPLLYSNSTISSPHLVHCARPLLWRDSLPSDYRAFALPSILPSSATAYRDFLASSSDFKRDYTFIAPRSFGSVEFRTACAQDETERVLELVALRMALATAVSYGLLMPYTDFRDYFYEACIYGRAPANVTKATLRSLALARELMPSRWIRYLERPLKLLEALHE